jgi:hypothetical protein
MSSTDSDELGKVVGMPLERVVGMTRNEWTASIGIDGRVRLVRSKPTSAKDVREDERESVYWHFDNCVSMQVR